MDASYALHFKAQGFVMRGMQRAFEPLQGRIFPGFSLRGHHRASAVWQHPAGGFTARVARGLLHRLLHLADVDALLGHPQAGRSWESMVSEEILRQLEWRGLDCNAFFYRTSAGAEIDLVVEGDVGLVPIEIKYTHTIDRRRLAALREFVAERGCRYGLVITNDSEPRLLDEAIVAILFSHL